MAFRSFSSLTGASSQTTAVVPVPAGAAIGDIAVVGIYKENTATITTIPTGFTLKVALTTSATARGALHVFWKRLTAADAGTYSFGWTGSTFRAANAGLWSGRIASGDPFDGFGTGESVAGVTSINCTAVPVAASGDAVGFWTNFNGGGAFTPPASYTERVETSGVICLDTRDAVASGTTGAISATCSITDFMKGFLGVLAVAGGGGTTPVTGTRSTTWRVAAQTTGTRSTTWRVRASVSGTRATTWDVLAACTSTRATTWRVRSAVTATRATTWAVASTLASVTATRATTWKVAARVTATRVVVWDTRTIVTSSRVATWDVLTRTTATRVATWDTLARATATRSTTWRALARPTSSRSTTWAVEVISVPYTPPEVVTATVRVYMSTASPRDHTPTTIAREYESTATVRSPE